MQPVLADIVDINATLEALVAPCANWSSLEYPDLA